jgi:hypothetical protein
MSVSRRCMPFAHGSYLRTLPQVKIMHLASPAITCMHSVSVSSGLLQERTCMTLRRVAWCYIHMTIRSQNMCESCFGRHQQRSRQLQACNSFDFMFTVRGNCNYIIRFRRSPVSSRTLICYSRIPPTAGTRASYRSGICFPRPSVIPVFPPHA